MCLYKESNFCFHQLCSLQFCGLVVDICIECNVNLSVFKTDPALWQFTTLNGISSGVFLHVFVGVMQKWHSQICMRWCIYCINQGNLFPIFLISQVREMISVLHSPESVGVYVLRHPIFPSVYLLSLRCVSFYIHNDLHYTLFLLTVSTQHSLLQLRCWCWDTFSQRAASVCAFVCVCVHMCGGMRYQAQPSCGS